MVRIQHCSMTAAIAGQVLTVEVVPAVEALVPAVEALVLAVEALVPAVGLTLPEHRQLPQNRLEEQATQEAYREAHHVVGQKLCIQP